MRKMKLKLESCHHCRQSRTLFSQFPWEDTRLQILIRHG
ncbi:hypothetical protein OIU77_012709 [Salix suchowensis]|uniref:Uncharacterized protein n=1 Tax=Salix suchowensis TaxID=1278906 RepID=A0ABQ9A4N8_9ROSI|nr:hypothetical protein OIU77_012709 [Salix suchowensis]